MNAVYRVGYMVLNDRFEKMGFFEKRERAEEWAKGRYLIVMFPMVLDFE
jgi:hypothetical protein